MEKFLLSFFIALCVLTFFILGVRQSAMKHMNSKPALEFVDRKNVVFDDQEERLQASVPYLIEGELLLEQADQVVIKFKYFVPPDDSSDYKITATPPSSDFINDQNTLQTGVHSVTVGIGFQPEVSLRRGKKTDYVTVSIVRRMGDGLEARIYARKIKFEKNWRSPSRITGPYIPPAQFITK